MGIWTTNNGNSYKVNIGQDQICKMKAAGARFCWFKDNPGINDENNEIYLQEAFCLRIENLVRVVSYIAFNMQSES